MANGDFSSTPVSHVCECWSRAFFGGAGGDGDDVDDVDVGNAAEGVACKSLRVTWELLSNARCVVCESRVNAEEDAIFYV
jgi:hypothetical protein